MKNGKFKLKITLSRYQEKDYKIKGNLIFLAKKMNLTELCHFVKFI